VPVTALLLALAAAGLHAAWNLLLARARDIEAATAVAVSVGVIAFLPAAAATWDVGGGAIPYVAASSALELAYFLLLAAAYARVDLSVVYPLARGLAPVLVLLVAGGVFGAAVSAGQLAGVALVAVGVLLVRGPRRPTRGTALGLLIAGVIAAYTLVDNSGIEHAAPLPYLELVLAPVALVALAAVGPRRARAALGPAAIAAGLASFGAYALVLAALGLAPAAPVAAVRETSVVLATALAAVVLGEAVTRARVAGAVLVAAGIVVIGSV
jgi:drug/metabolite transporter (DMT)-like permease